MVGRVVLQVRDLETRVRTQAGTITAVNRVCLDLREGETLGLVGESGSGKTMTGLSLLRMLPPAAEIVGGQVLLNGEDLLTKTDDEMAQIRGRTICMVMQDAMTALNPVLSIRDQMTEALRIEDHVDSKDASARALDLLGKFQIADALVKFAGYPHQMSGGMRQRVVSAIAVSRRPLVLIADEPTTSLDATLQLAYLRLLKQVQLETNLAVIFITHDFGIVERMCDRVAVMYAGRIVETASTADLLGTPAHPYATALLNSVPDVDQRLEFLPTIKGEPANLENLPAGCSFEPRCPLAFDVCRVEYPPEFPVSKSHVASCWRLRDRN